MSTTFSSIVRQDHSPLTTHHSPLTRRKGFTLVELLVAMALIVFMMVILSEAFSVGLGSFRKLKAVGDMNGRLRTALVALQTDLQDDHFEAKKRISDPNFWAAGPPANGFFRIWHGSRPSPAGPNYFIEDRDAGGDQIPSTRATDHILHFTVKRRGNDRKDFFVAGVPSGSPLSGIGLTDARYQDTPGTYTSQWAEVAYFLRPNGNLAGTTPLFALYRRQRLAVPDDHVVNQGPGRVAAGELGKYLEVSCMPQGGNLYFNGPMDLTIPQRRLGMDRTVNGGVIPAANGGLYPRIEDDMAVSPGGPDLATADLLVPDVISFEVTVLLEDGQEFVDLYHESVARFQSGNPRFTAAAGPRVFDTWTNYKDNVYDYSGWDVRGPAAGDTSIPLYQYQPPTPPGGVTPAPVQIRITALKITLRIWDVKTGQARQISLIQDM